MTVEERLREAMGARTAEVDAPAWSTVVPRMSPRRRVWPVAVAGFAVVLVVVLTLWAVTRNSSDDQVRPASRRGYPSRMVAVTTDGRLMVLSSQDGHALRTLATGASAGGGLAVSPDGATVYFARTTGGRCSNGDPITDIVAVPLSGGAGTLIASNVRDPAVSPDGGSLAFTGIPNCSDAGQTILVKNLRAGDGSDGPYDASWSPTPGRAGVFFGITALSWAPDSRHLLFTRLDAPDGTYPRILDTGLPETTLDAAPQVKIGDASNVCCYLGSKGTLVGSATFDDRVSTWTFDPTSGARLRRLTCCGTVVAADRSGRSLLIYWTDPEHPGAIYRWTTGDRRPTYLGSLLVTAAWVP